MSARLVSIAAALLLTVTFGCDSAMEVGNRKVLTEQAVYDANHITPRLTADGDTPDRMLGAIIPVGRQIWFFKIVGAEAAVHEVGQRLEVDPAGRLGSGPLRR